MRRISGLEKDCKFNRINCVQIAKTYYLGCQTPIGFIINFNNNKLLLLNHLLFLNHILNKPLLIN